MLPFTADILFASFEAVQPRPVAAPHPRPRAGARHDRPGAAAGAPATERSAHFWRGAGSGSASATILHSPRSTSPRRSTPPSSSSRGCWCAGARWSETVSLSVSRPTFLGWTGLALAPLQPGVAACRRARRAGWPSVRVVGLAPGPTRPFTLDLLLLVEGRALAPRRRSPAMDACRRRHRQVLGIPQDQASRCGHRRVRPDPLAQLASAGRAGSAG